MIGNDLLFQAQSLKHGKLYGYPECCIVEFCKQTPSILAITQPTHKDRNRYKASLVNGEYTGFVPCTKHAEMILRNEITLASLIQNRDPGLQPFPINWTFA